MREFFRQCLKDLEALTGKQQLRYWEIEAASDDSGIANEAPRKVEICISGMVFVSKEFDYIPESDQQKIIRKCMITDSQNYDSLTSAVIYKWLNQHASVYWSQKGRITEEQMTTPATDEQVDYWVNEFKRLNLEVGKQVPKLTPEELGQIKDPILKDARKTFPKHEARPEFIINEGFVVNASNEYEARKAFEATFPNEAVQNIRRKID